MSHEPTSEADGMKGLYRERAHLLALLAGVLDPSMSHIGETDTEAEGWPVLTFETLAGQWSWHIAPDDVALFAHVRPTTAADRAWDGHTTAEKYARVDRLSRAMGAGQAAVVAVLNETRGS